MNVTIEEKNSFQILAVSREFHEKNGFLEIPKFWTEYYAHGNADIACGQYGVCVCGGDGNGNFRYGIGNECRVEKRADGTSVYHIFNRPDRTEIPEGFELLTVPAATWAVFECFGALPHSIQDMWPRIYQEWLPEAPYHYDGAIGFDIEEYGKCETAEDLQKPDYHCVIRIPVKKNDFLFLAKSRCTTREFSERVISDEHLNRILEAGRVAPSACNRQPQKILVVRSPENLRKAELACPLFSSQCVLIVCRDRRNELVRPSGNKCSGDLDIGIVCDHMMLQARELGIGSAMVGWFDPAIICGEFHLPADMVPAALLILGYPKDKFASPERHASERKPLNETVMFESWHCALE